MKTLQELKPGDAVVLIERVGTLNKDRTHSTFKDVRSLATVMRSTAKRIAVSHYWFDKVTGHQKSDDGGGRFRRKFRIEVPTDGEVAKLRRRDTAKASRESKAKADRDVLEQSLVWRIAAAIGWQSTEQAARKLRTLTSPALRELAVAFKVIEL